MKYIYAIKDNAISAFNQPIFVRAPGEAVRAFRDECNNPQSDISKHPEDYELWAIGTYDEETGMLMPSQPTRTTTARAEQLGDK